MAVLMAVFMGCVHGLCSWPCTLTSGEAKHLVPGDGHKVGVGLRQVQGVCRHIRGCIQHHHPPVPGCGLGLDLQGQRVMVATITASSWQAVKGPASRLYIGCIAHASSCSTTIQLCLGMDLA